MKRMPHFVLQFDPSEIDGLAERYGPDQDSEALAAGTDIDRGNYSREKLKVIVRWKSARRVALLDDNTEEELPPHFAMPLILAHPTNQRSRRSTSCTEWAYQSPPPS